MLLNHSMKKVLALVATTSSRGSLSNMMAPTSTAVYSTSSSSIAPTAKNLLFDLPVSNNGGRARIILYVTYTIYMYKLVVDC